MKRFVSLAVVVRTSPPGAGPAVALGVAIHGIPGSGFAYFLLRARRS